MREDQEFIMVNMKKTEQSNGDASSSSPNDEWKILNVENHKLKCRIEQLEAVLHAKSFNIDDIKAMVDPFSGEGTIRVHKWIEKLDDAFRVLKLNKSQQLVAACALLTETAATFRRTVQFNDYDDFKAKLVAEFKGYEVNDVSAVTELRKKKMQDKKVLKYVLEMIEIASSYNIAEIDLVDIIIDGLGDTSHDVVMLYGAKTIAELKSLLPRYKKRRYPSNSEATRKEISSEEEMSEDEEQSPYYIKNRYNYNS